MKAWMGWLLLALASPLCAQEGPPSVEYEMFPDEAGAVAAYNAGPGEETLRRVSEVRFHHAVRLLDEFFATGDKEAGARAVSYAETVLEDDPGHVRCHLLLGGLAFLAAEQPGFADGYAEEHLQAVLDAEPQNAAARKLLGMLWLKRDFFDRALNEFEQLLRDHPELADEDLIAVMGMAYSADNQQDRGARFFRERLAEDENQTAVRMGLATMLLEEGDAAEAAALLDGVANDPGASGNLKDVARALIADLAGTGAQP